MYVGGGGGWEDSSTGNLAELLDYTVTEQWEQSEWILQQLHNTETPCCLLGFIY